MRALVLYLLTLTLLGTAAIACQAITDSTSPITGLEGRVLAGPQCPVVQIDQPCPDKPFRATFDVFDSRERPITRFESDADGFFEVALQPGTYTIIPDEAPLLNARSQQHTVAVQPDSVTHVTLYFDTGIR